MEMTPPGDQLAYVLATRGTMQFKRASDRSANSFEDAAATLLRLAGRASSPLESLWELATDLSELGFCEIEWSVGQTKIHATQPVLAILPSPQSEAVLCGARTPRFIEAFQVRTQAAGAPQRSRAFFENICPEVLRPVHRDLLPTPIRLQSAAPEDFQAIASSCPGLKCPAAPPAWACLHAAPNLSDFENSRANCFQKQNPAFLSHVEWFNFKSARWQPITPGRLPQGPLFLARTTDRGTQFALGRINQDATLAIDPGDASFDARWARWMVLAHVGATSVLHDRNKKRLAIPRLCPLPALLGRALALCSGLPAAVWKRELINDVPDSLPGKHLRVYSEVPDAFASILAKKLGTTPCPSNLELPTEALQNSLIPAFH